MSVNRKSPSSGDCAFREERFFANARISSIRRWQHPLLPIKDPKGHQSQRAQQRVRMEAGRRGDCERQHGFEIKSPFPVAPLGQAGRAGSPHAAKIGRLPPQEGHAPLRDPPAHASKIFVDNRRPSHGSAERITY
jgi:hypothetical protein